MLRRLIAFAALIVLTGCSDNSPPKPSGTSGGGSTTKEPTYLIKFGALKEGDKAVVTRTRSGTVTMTVGGKSKTQEQNERYEYTETILELPAGATKPTKANRTFKTAQKSDEKGELKTLSYSGETVEIMVSPIKNVGYIFIVGGNALQPPERDDFLAEFQGPEMPKLDDLLPKDAVKAGEEWTAPLAAIHALIGKMDYNVDKDKSRVTGKLVRAYTKDGHQWGVIELKIQMVINPAAKGPPLSGTINGDATLDAVIDGSVNARSVKMDMDGTLSTIDPKAGEIKLKIKGKQETSRTPIK